MQLDVLASEGGAPAPPSSPPPPAPPASSLTDRPPSLRMRTGHWRAVLGVTARFLLRRILRIVPAYAAALLVFFLVVSNSSAPLGVAQASYCRERWWTNVLFINNFFDNNTSCMGWSWTIAIEIQFYLLSPLLVYLSLRSERLAMPLLAVVTAGSMVAYMVLTAQVFGPTALQVDFTDAVYQRPYTRSYAYTLGMMAALAVERDVATDRERRGSVSATSNKLTVMTPADVEAGHAAAVATDAHSRSGVCTRRWWKRLGKEVAVRYLPRLVAVAVVVVVTFCCKSHQNFTTEVDSPDDYLQLVFSRPLFSLGMAYIVYDLLSPRTNTDRYARVVNAILASRPMYILAQLSYGIYLLHLTFVFVLYTAILKPHIVDGSLVYNPQWLVAAAFGVVTAASILGAVVIFFAVERPGINVSTDFVRRPGKQ
jgi:peptidoglycan/LPS O-acetylase OafA/YrhL